MNNNLEVLKITDYDKFKCTADKCRLTCCEGWDISVDEDTYNKWKSEWEAFTYILDNVKIKKGRNKTGYFIKKRTEKVCPLLDEKGLCEIVKNHGEEYLSLTCHKFPRIENNFSNRMELSLSCACPEVVNLISSLKCKIELVSQNTVCSVSDNDVFEIKMRNALIHLCQLEGILLEDRLIIGFEMLLKLLSIEADNENIFNELKKYESLDHINGLVIKHRSMDINFDEIIEEFNNLFLDIVMNYKSVSGLKSILKSIAEFAENIDINNDLLVHWNTYKKLINKYSNLIENYVVAKVISTCTSSNIEDMAISFQIIILEYLFMRYAGFIKYCTNRKLDIEDIKNYITAFSRIIGNNSSAVIEYFSNEFGEDILEIDYLRLITFV